jgi:MFS family permease
MNLASGLSLSSDRRRWVTLAVVCLAQLMIVLDVTIVNVALPSIQRDLHFQPGEPQLGRQRVPRHLRQPAAFGRPAR